MKVSHSLARFQRWQSTFSIKLAAEIGHSAGFLLSHRAQRGDLRPRTGHWGHTHYNAFSSVDNSMNLRDFLRSWPRSTEVFDQSVELLNDHSSKTLQHKSVQWSDKVPITFISNENIINQWLINCFLSDRLEATMINPLWRRNEKTFNRESSNRVGLKCCALSKPL